jgi:hypothetical protein
MEAMELLEGHGTLIRSIPTNRKGGEDSGSRAVKDLRF